MPRKAKNKENPVQQPQQNEMEIDFDDDQQTQANYEFDENDDLLNVEIPPKPQTAAFNEGDERLVISHIEVENFKSYYGKQIIGPFHKCFTSIIGPNGSGKSNVIDAMLFVFGYRASKIRSKKISVLIHSSAGRDNLHFCTVTVHFCKIIDNADGVGYTKIEGSDIKVSRTAYKDSSSKYTLNGRTVKFKEVAELLRANGIDLVHNRFLILQGEVEQISMMKPKAEKEDEEGMLEYLEDIIGSSRLKSLIGKLQTKIEKINDRRVIQLQRVQHMEKEKMQLDKPVREVLGQMRLENAITLLNDKIFHFKKSNVENKLNDLKTEKTKLDEDLWESKNKLTAITNQTKQISKERQQLQSKLDKCHESVQSIEKQKSTQEQIVTKTENDMKRFENRREKLIGEVEAEKEKFTDLESVPEKSQRKIEEYRQQLEKANAEIEESSPILMKKLEEVRESVKAEEGEKAEFEKNLGKLTAEEDELNGNLALAQEKVMNLRREEETQRRKFDALQTEMLETEERLAKNEKEFAELEEQFPELETTYEGKTARLEHLKERERRLNERIQELRQQHEELKQTEENYHSNNKLLDRLMEAKRSGEIPGILGRLGDLGGIDEQYHVAISTNYPQLEYVVVDDVQTARKCIELLNHEDLGRYSFIALDKQQHFWPNIRKIPQTPENIPRLFDLIRFNDEKVLPAFYFILGEALVADDIETATRVAVGRDGKRWRTVTLRGELVDTSGAMTGGGNPCRTTRIGREVRVKTNRDAKADEERKQQIAALGQELNNAEGELTGIRRECTQLDPELQKREEDLRKQKNSIRDLRLEIENNKAKINEFKKQIEVQKRTVINSTANPEEVRKAEQEVQEFKIQSDKIAKETDSLRTRVMTINDRINEVEERIAGPCKRRKMEAEEQKKEAENGINKERANITSNERNKKKVETKIRNLEQDINDVERQLEAAQQRNMDAKDRINEMEDLINQQRTELENAREALNEFVQSIGERNDEELELQKRVEQLQRDQKQMGADLASMENKLKTYQTKISKLRLYRLKKLTETLSKELPKLNLQEDEQEEENDENILENEDSASGKNQQKTPQPEIGDDGLDEFLEDCYKAEEEQNQMNREYNPQNQMQMEIDEDEDERMEVDEGENAANESVAGTANTSTRSRRQQHNASNISSATAARQPPMPSYLHQRCFIALAKLDEAKIREFDSEKLERDLEVLESKRTKTRINLAIVIEYHQKVNRYELEFRTLNEINEMRERHREFHDRLKKQRLYEFMEGFQQIATLLRTTYQMITIQGDVSLELVDSLDPFSEGIAFNVRPPKKSWKQITNLSGGEKTLASLSLVFGLHHYKPTPLYVMDEIDAALDFRNVSIIANYLLERTRNAQFIVISLRNQMYEKADRLIGIFKVKDCTKNVCVDPRNSSSNNANANEQNGQRRTKPEINMD